MKKGNLSTITLSHEVKELLIKLRKRSDTGKNWDVFLIDVVDEICSKHNIDLGLSVDEQFKIDLITGKVKKPERIHYAPAY